MFNGSEKVSARPGAGSGTCYDELTTAKRRFALSDPELVPGYRHREVVSNDGTMETIHGKFQ